MFKVYVSSSMQENNIGVNGYGTEEDNMFNLADRVKELLLANGNFEVFRNQKTWSLSQLVVDVNSKDCSLFVDNHSNAGASSAQGCEVYYYGQGGTTSNSYKISELLYNEVKNVSPNIDRGIKPDTSLYTSGLYVIQNTTPPATLIEHFFHSNISDVAFWKVNLETYAQAEYRAICNYFNVTQTTVTPPTTVTPTEGLYDSEKVVETINDLNGLISSLTIQRDYYREKLNDLYEWSVEVQSYGGV